MIQAQNTKIQYDNEYIDVMAINANNINSLPVPVQFTQTRNLPFLQKPEDYYLSVIRFQIDAQILPVINPFIQFNQANKNLTIYSTTLSWTNPIAPFQQVNQQTYVVWIPQDNSSPIPQSPNATEDGFQDNSTGYYYAYNYSYFIQLCNNCFTTCFNALNAQVVGLGLVLPTTHAPVLTWNVDKNIAVLNADILGYGTTASNINIYFNLPMYQLFNSIPAYLDSNVSTIGKNYRIDTNSFGASTVIPFPFYLPTYNVLQIFQEQSSISLWSPISSIVFTSNTLPINSTNICNPTVFLNGITTNENGNNGNVQQIITDFQAVDNIFKNNILYIPSAQYRYIDLMGTTPLYTIDINVFWKNKVGTLIPFRLVAGASASIKILFERKALILGEASVKN